MMQHCTKWEPVSGIDNPCADIAFTYEGPDAVSITMHFSSVNNGSQRDLLLKFRGAISLRWESESFGLIPIAKILPKCEGNWAAWTFPLLRIEHSDWLATYKSHNPVASENRVHFTLIALNDLLHVLALPDVNVTWAADASSDNCRPI
jgi:hypothetical protein